MSSGPLKYKLIRWLTLGVGIFNFMSRNKRSRLLLWSREPKKGSRLLLISRGANPVLYRESRTKGDLGQFALESKNNCHKIGKILF